ncbi:hypothetical protein [Fusicatenibacter sp.]
MAPVLYVLNALELICIILPTEVLYLLLIHRFQSAYPVYATNVGNSLFFAVAGLLLGIYMANMKFSGIYNIYMNARAEEIRKLNEELSESRNPLCSFLDLQKTAGESIPKTLGSLSPAVFLFLFS